MERVTVATFTAESPAKVVRDRLAQAGIEATVVDEKNLHRFWFFTRHYAGIRVKVAKDDFEKAGELLERLDKEEGLLREAIRCPQCSSSRIEYPQMTRHFVLPNLFMQVGHLLGVVPMEFYCRTCQHVWQPRPTEEMKTLKKRPTPAP